MPEDKLAIVMKMLDSEAQGDLSVMAQHAGMKRVLKNAILLKQVMRIDSQVFHEKLVADDWVIVRYTSQATALTDLPDMDVGTVVTSEVMAMYLVEAGEIKRQYSHFKVLEMLEP